MLLVGGLLLLVAIVGLVVLGLLGLGLWRRLVALVDEVGRLGERLAAVTEGAGRADSATGNEADHEPDREARPGQSPGRGSPAPRPTGP